MAEGLFYNDSLPPFLDADVGQVTLSTTDKALIPLSAIPILPQGFFNKFRGKSVRVRLFGRFSSGNTPGNGTFSMYWGTGADANGTIICATAAIVLIASLGNSSWMLDCTVRSRVLGGTGVGTLFGTGTFTLLNNATTTAAASPYMIPATAPAASGTLDLTAALQLSPQFKRSGSTSELMTVHEVDYKALN